MFTSWRGEERRSQKRYQCCGTVKLIYPHTQTALPATLSDISLSGCALHLRKEDALDDDTVIELNFKTSYLTFRALGCIRSFESGELLVRVAFLDLNKRGYADIRAYIQDQMEERSYSPKSSAQLAAA